MKKFLFPLLATLLLGVGCSKIPIPIPIACTEEAKQCPDGSYVGRTGPKCEFASCPAETLCEGRPCPEPPANAQSGIEGTVTIGPTCPVERMPPDPACAEKPYQATIKVETLDGQKTITHFTSARDGTFKIDLAPGTYLLVPVSNGMLPRGESQTITVEKNSYTHVNITFDSGIR